MNVEAKDKILVITGGASGIGAGIVEAFLKEGAKHVSFLDINDTVGKEFESKLKKTFGSDKAQFIQCDVTNDEKLLQIYDQIFNKHGYIDVVINNAGIMNDGRHIYRKEIDINLSAVASSTFKALDLMRKDQGGRGGTIFNFASIAALARCHVLPVYFATKSAVLQFTNCISMEPQYSRSGVRMLTICFGKTDTALIQNAQAYDEKTNQEIPEVFAKFPEQKPESAVKGVMKAFKNGENGSTWLATTNKPAKDITAKVNQAYQILTDAMNED